MTHDEKDKLIARAVSTSSGRAKLAAAMMQPLRTRNDYLGFSCPKCGMRNPDKNYVHSHDECVVAEVLLS